MTYDYRVAVARATITRSEALAVFGLTAPIGLTELKSLYRKKSLESHVDHGGTREQNQRLNEAYDILRGVAIPKPEPASYDYRGGPEPGWGKKPPPRPRERSDDERRRRQERQDADDRQRAKERAEQEEAARAERARKEQWRSQQSEETRKREEDLRRKREESAKSRDRVPGSVPREAVSRARARMYDAYDRASGDPSFKFNKMLIALKTRVRAITDPAKLAGVLEMLRQETTDPQFMKRWSQSEIATLKQILEILSR